ncbi:MAG: ABC transporter ATP-binding protein [Blautia sp.]|nr:ABC transporter ATP-binding protein [Blautia sp.]
MNMLECHGLTKCYGKVTALDNLDLTLESGRIVGLLGPNGSGKTTLIKLATRLIQPTKGSIMIAGQLPGHATKAITSYLPDREYLPNDLRVKSLLGLYRDFYRDFNEKKALDMLESLDISERMELKKMSKGTKEKVRLILTMSRDAKIYLLDEPIAGVDPAARDYILRTIIQNYSEDALVIISTHLIADVEAVLDEAVFIRQGKLILHQTVDEIRQETGKSVDEHFREVFRC